MQSARGRHTLTHRSLVCAFRHFVIHHVDDVDVVARPSPVRGGDADDDEK
jgi:hypothetical protein